VTAVAMWRRGVLGPAEAAGGRTRVVDVIATVGVAVGLFTVSWDRLANLSLGGYNVKLPSLVFSLAAVAVLPLLVRRRGEFRARWVRTLGLLTAVLVVVLVLSTVLSAHPTAGLAQLAAVVTGALAPGLAVFGLLRTRSDLLWALRWFLAGAALASLFGLYQLAAFYAGWPQFIAYTGVGVDGDAGRISSFSYEPAYFANFIVLAAGAAMSVALLQGRRMGWWVAAAFAVVLVLVNVRALYFVLPVFAVLLAFRWRQNRTVLLRFLVVGAVVIGVDIGAMSAIEQATAQAVQEPQQAAAPEAPRTVAPLPEPDPTARADSPVNVLNPNEQSSNAPRLALYTAVLKASLEEPVLGLGPGNLGPALAADGYIPPNQGTQVVANNVWLQALADGGILLVLTEAGIVALVVVQLFRRATTPLQPLIAAWLAVLGVSGMLTSYFFDVKIWVVLGVVAAAVVIARGTGTPISSARMRAARRDRS